MWSVEMSESDLRNDPALPYEVSLSLAGNLSLTHGNNFAVFVDVGTPANVRGRSVTTKDGVIGPSSFAVPAVSEGMRFVCCSAGYPHTTRTEAVDALAAVKAIGGERHGLRSTAAGG